VDARHYQGAGLAGFRFLLLARPRMGRVVDLWLVPGNRDAYRPACWLSTHGPAFPAPRASPPRIGERATRRNGEACAGARGD
jgi:hypothetical protein